jgi:cytochrome c oxidase cbb3-type subunit 2
MRITRLVSRSLVAAAAIGGVAALIVHGDAPAGEPPAVPSEPLTAADWPLSASEQRGREVFALWCVGCHGEEGRGDGPAAALLDPLPRNFRAAKFKFRSTASGELPLESDVMRTVTCGLPGSSMPAFPLLPEIERRDVVRYVLSLAKLGLANREVVSLMTNDGTPIEKIRAEELPGIRTQIEAAAAALRRVPVPPEPTATPESIERGRANFAKQCAACHGAGGVGDGTSSYALRDWQNAVIRPRDFTSGVFRSGSTPEDVFVRIKTGLNGTPMPGYSNLPDAELWDLVHFILSLKDPRAETPRVDPACAHDGGAR